MLSLWKLLGNLVTFYCGSCAVKFFHFYEDADEKIYYRHCLNVAQRRHRKHASCNLTRNTQKQSSKDIKSQSSYSFPQDCIWEKEIKKGKSSSNERMINYIILKVSWMLRSLFFSVFIWIPGCCMVFEDFIILVAFVLAQWW